MISAKQQRLELRETERRLLQILRIQGPSSKAELARLTGMSAQGASVIVDRLLDLGIVAAGPKKRGRVGQPSTPMLINADSVVALGVHLREDGASIAVCGLDGARIDYRELGPADSARSLAVVVSDACLALAAKHPRIVAATVITPPSKSYAQMGEAPAKPGPSAGLVRRQIAEKLGCKVVKMDEVEAACLSLLGHSPDEFSRMTLHIDLAESVRADVFSGGTFLGRPADRRTQFGGVLVPTVPAKAGGLCTLEDVCSTSRLKQMLSEAGQSFETLGTADGVNPRGSEAFELWCREVSEALEFAIQSVRGILPLDHFAISAALPESCIMVLRDVLTASVGDLCDSSATMSVSGEQVGGRAFGAATAGILGFLGFIENEAQGDQHAERHNLRVFAD